MRTLQEKYNAIQEGKFSKDQFLVEARQQLPNLVTRFNGYDDAVQILKNRGMIVEAKVEEAKLTKKSLTDYRYKPTNDMDKYPYEQILRGLRVELETAGVLGTPTPEEYSKALSKVSKNLEKDSIYYTNQVAGVNPKVDLHDKMVTATAKNTVDTFNGMKKAALKEGFKKLIKKVLSENSNDLADLFDADEEREERRYTTNDYGDHGPESDFGDSFDNIDPENYSEEEEMFEMHGPKSDTEYKSELQDYLEDNQIYGYTDMIHDIMTGPDEEENSASLADFLDDHQIYGYNKGIERIFADYPYDQHWQNQPDQQDMIDESKTGLMVIGRTKIDNNAIGDVLDELDLYGEWEAREGYWFLPEDESTYDDLEEMLEQEFATRGINARFEGIFGDQNSIESNDLYEGKKSLMELLDEGSSKHSTEWHKGYRAYNDSKELKNNPYKENPEKKDWIAGWKQANSDEKSSK